jgi:lysophospholipase L1-like esterase
MAQTQWQRVDPEHIHGQGWKNDQRPFNRLPHKAIKKVREAVWNLGKHAAGLSLEFTSNASQIEFRYVVENELAYPHMPATGKSGIDLYTYKNKQEFWIKGNYRFKDTIYYQYKGIDPLESSKNTSRKHKLYLPLYNSVKWMEYRINPTASLNFVPPNNIKPIVIYGTSIAQGACATRPGMAWGNIVARQLEQPVINLGFSGNGRLEAPIIDLINELNPSLVILDCLPNFYLNGRHTLTQVKERLLRSVAQIRKQHPNIPILLTQHMGYAEAPIQYEKTEAYQPLNQTLIETFHQLRQQGHTNLYTLSKEEIGLDHNSYVDGTHPNDMGMLRYAEAYLKKIAEILPEKP